MSEVLSVTVERSMPYPPEKVWRALTQPHLIADWLMQNDFRAEKGHHFSLRGDWGSLDCEVLEIDEHRSLSYRWDHANDNPAYDLRSVVTFTLTPTESGTHISMTQTGFRPEQKQAHGGARYGWQGHLENLEKTVAKLA